MQTADLEEGGCRVDSSQAKYNTKGSNSDSNAVVIYAGNSEQKLSVMGTRSKLV